MKSLIDSAMYVIDQGMRALVDEMSFLLASECQIECPCRSSVAENRGRSECLFGCDGSEQASE